MSKVEENQKQLDNANGYSEVWSIVKSNVRVVLGQYRSGMMLFLDDLPLRLGAYHPMGTNNIVLNRSLVHVIEAATESRKLLNAFIYILLLHEYLHALGYARESKVRPLVYKISSVTFGEEHVVTHLAKLGPWALLRDLPLNALKAPVRVMEIVKDFEKTNQKYIV